MFNNKEEYRAYLQGLTSKQLLGPECLEALAEQEIEAWLDAIRDDLESLYIEDLLDHEFLELLAQEEIERRVAEFQERTVVAQATAAGREVP